MRWPHRVEIKGENGSVCELQDWGQELVIVMESGSSLTPADTKRLLYYLGESAENGQLPQQPRPTVHEHLP